MSAPVDQGRSYQICSDIPSCVCIQPLVDFLRGSKGCSLGFPKQYQPLLGYTHIQSLFLFLSLFRPSFDRDRSWVFTPLSFQLAIQLSSTAPTFNTQIVCYKGGHCGICRHPGWLSPFFLFIMHPSSFYDLQACYIYTPLYGPYSLSEALDGLIYYTLDKSWDSISIGSKRSLQHELVSELSNVVDDLQDYLFYFSSKFIISPVNSPDLIEELRASHDKFKHLIVCWGAIVACLNIACKIIEHNFWPHFFQPAINNLTDFQRLRQHPPFALPDASFNKSFTSTSTSILSPNTDSAPYPTYRPLKWQGQLFNVRSECPQTEPSKSNPTGGKEDRKLSLGLNTTPTPPGLHTI